MKRIHRHGELRLKACCFRLEPQMIKFLKRKAKRMGINESEALRFILRGYFEIARMVERKKLDEAA